MTKKIRLIIIVLILIIFVSCKSPQKAVDPVKSCAVGIKINLKWWHNIYFLRLNENDDLFANQVYIQIREYFSEKNNKRIFEKALLKELVAVNYSRFNYRYALNIKPGRYAVVLGRSYLAVNRKDSYKKYKKYFLFDDKIIKNSIVTVKSGEISYMGDYKVENEETHNASNESEENTFYITKMDEFRRDRDSETVFLKYSLDILGKHGWEKIISKRLKSIEKK